MSPQWKPSFVLVTSLAFFLLLSFRAPVAFAHDVPKVPPHVTSAVVRVDAYEHTTFGVVIGDGSLVLVPFETIEVARPGFPHALVTDAKGVRHDAGLVATDRESGLALLAVEHPITTTPLAMSPHGLADHVDTLAIAGYDTWAWSFFPAGTLAGRGRAPADYASYGHPGASPWPPREGSPIIDVEGRLVGIMGEGVFLSPRPMEVSAAALARLDGTQRARRPWIFYGGMTVPFAFAPNGGLWFGLGLSFGARIRDVVELRLDAEFSALVPARSPPDACGGKCYAGIQGVATPSIGYRYVVGGVGGARAFPIALTPSLGLALGVQDTSRANGAPVYDAATPSTWAQVAPGLGLSIWLTEIRGRVRIPVDDTRSPTVELSVGVFF